MKAHVLVALGLAMASCPDLGTEDPVDSTPAENWAAYCALCHGARGEGYTADLGTALANQEFLATAPDELLRVAIARGRPGTSMSGWAKEVGGPLVEREVDALVEWIRLWQTVPSLDLSQITVTGEPERGAPLWEFECATCHGAQGEGGTYVSVANPTFLATASDGFLRYGIARGRPGTVMEAFEDRLTPQGIDDLVALIRAWQEPFDDDDVPMPTLDPDNLVVNPDGPAPDLGDGRFVSVDVVAAEMDRGAAMVVVDARPPGDYVRSHIAGAISVPFYAVADVVDVLPPDRWFVTYCACPHAEAEEAADALAEHGFSQVRVLDEGVRVWEQRGYPMRAGTAP